MSSTNRGRDRQRDDFYETPSWCVDALMLPFKGFAFAEPESWLEPCVGTGAIITACNTPKDHVWTAVELRPELSWPVTDSYVRYFPGENFLLWEAPKTKFDVAITNPPFSLALPIIQKCLKIADVTVMLLRLNWLEPAADRCELLKTNPPDIYVLPARPSFQADGKTDSIPYAWFIWGLTEGGHYQILDLPDSYPKKRKQRSVLD